MSAHILHPTAPFPVNRLDMRGKVLWTVGNLLMLIGLYLLLYVGGLYADEQYNFMAAQRGSDIVLPETLTASPDVAATDPAAEAATGGQPSVDALGMADAAAPAAAAAGSRLPRLNSTGDGRELNTIVPSTIAGFGPSSIQGIIIPRISLERKVIPVGMAVEVQNGQKVAVWEVAKYAVGHHKGTANPGQAGNIVLAGHSGGKAYPFNDIFYLKQGDAIVLESKGRRYEYSVTQRLVLDEVGVPMAQRIANARYIEPTETEVVTLVTCWPLTGKNKFTQRVVVRAAPLHNAAPAPDPSASEEQIPELPPVAPEPIGGWTAR